MTVNYERVYRLRDAQTDCLSNLKVRYRNEAEVKAAADFQLFSDAIQAELGTDDFEVTNIACLASGIWHHVYSPAKGIPPDQGKRVCIFCGLDDLDV